jgi:hypothetical protein
MESAILSFLNRSNGIFHSRRAYAHLDRACVASAVEPETAKAGHLSGLNESLPVIKTLKTLNTAPDSFSDP